MMLRLDPAIPLIWRDPRTLQFGVDPALAVLELTPAHERLVAALASGVSESGFRMLAETPPPDGIQGDELLATLASCLLPEQSTTVRRRPRQAVVLGEGPLAISLARLLDESGLRRHDARRRPGLVVLVADRVLRPADHRTWLQRDIPHLPVVRGDAAVTVGPLVIPGESACLHCVLLHRRDEDRAWPAISAQLAALAPPPPHPLRTAAATAYAGRIVADALRGRAEPGVEWRIEGDGQTVSERRVAPHPECRCAAPPGSDWAPADATAAPRPTSAARASSERA